MVTYIMVFVYISFCVCIATKPCKYFQLNAKFFDREKGIFSKIGIDQLIPGRWRLAQFYDDGIRQPERYPVFVKPEWSQNAQGVERATDASELRRIRAKIAGAGVAYLIQEGAVEVNEYEIFSMQYHRDPERYAVFSVTQACNDSEPYPVNSVYNQNTRYVEITDSFSSAQLGQLWALVRQLGKFWISRVSLRANSTAELLAGNFHIIEVNLFLPMPIHLLDERYSRRDILALVMTYMKALALATKYRDKSVQTKPVFLKSMLYNRRSGLLNFLRARL